jgi:hypothetical protein
VAVIHIFKRGSQHNNNTSIQWDKIDIIVSIFDHL